VSVRVRPAVADDVPAILGLVDAAVAWLVGRGRAGQWGAAPLSATPGFADRAAEWVAAGVVTVAESDGRCVGALAAADGVPPYVPDGLVPAAALYVYTIVTDRGLAAVGWVG
jgi:hypothetical protein